VFQDQARKEIIEGVGRWVLAGFLWWADIITDSPCILPFFSSKGMLALGSSVSYCEAPAKKRKGKWL